MGHQASELKIDNCPSQIKSRWGTFLKQPSYVIIPPPKHTQTYMRSHTQSHLTFKLVKTLSEKIILIISKERFQEKLKYSKSSKTAWVKQGLTPKCVNEVGGALHVRVLFRERKTRLYISQSYHWLNLKWVQFITQDSSHI